MKFGKRVGLTLLFGSTALLSLMAALGAITSYIYAEKVMPRTLVAGVNVSNLSYPDAEQKIALRSSELSGLKISFTLKDKVANASLGSLGVKVDQQSVLSQVIRPGQPLDWLRPSYWRTIFSQKNIAFGYQGDPSVIRSSIESALGITTAAKDANITYEAGQLVVHESQAGISVSDDKVSQAIATVLATGAPTRTILAFTESNPLITTDSANQTKAEISQQLIPIQLVAADKIFTITAASEEAFLNFTTTNNKITWGVSTDKIKNYLNSTIAPKVNVKMVSQTTMSDTGQVTEAGVDGRQADLTKLANDIAQVITQHIDTTSSPIAINTTAIPFTQKTIYPGFVANLYPGLYADVNLSTQQMSILNGPTLIATYLVSTGQAGLRTPPGLFYVCNKIPIARSPLYKSLWMPLWNALSTSPDGCDGYVGYGVHGLPCFNGSCTLVESAAHLGRPVSHGCVRLPDDGARWFYDNMPIGTPVNIHN